MKRSIRFAGACILLLVGGIAFIHAASLCAFAFFQLHVAKTMAEDDEVIVTTKLIPHLQSPKNHFSLLDLADMQKVSAQTTADMLSMIQQAFLSAGLWFCVSLVCWLLLRWLFPDRKELFRATPIPGIPAAWQRPIKFW